MLAADNVLVNLDPRLLDALLCQPVHSGVRVDPRELVDFFGVARQVSAGPDTDFQNGTVSVGEQSSPVPSQQRLVQEEVAKAWDDDL